MSAGSRVMILSEMEAGQQGDCYVLLEGRSRASTREGKPYFRVIFRDRLRRATAMIWSDSGWFAECEQKWRDGGIYKVRCKYIENQYGPQVEVDRIREIDDSDRENGFDPSSLFAATRFNIAEMYAELLGLATQHITDAPLSRLVCEILQEHAEGIRRMPAANRNHHAYTGGYLEHVLSVTRLAVLLADKYSADYPDLNPPLSKSLVVAGAILHDIGKMLELEYRPQGSTFTASGRLIGHILLGRDLVREKAATIPDLDPEVLLRLEHIIVSHQNLPEWGSPVAPHTPEALLVHYADDLDAKFQMMATALSEKQAEDEEFTSRDNALRRAIFRQLRREPKAAD